MIPQQHQEALDSEFLSLLRRDYHHVHETEVDMLIRRAGPIGVMALRFASPVKLRARQIAEGGQGVRIADGAELSGRDLFG